MTAGQNRIRTFAIYCGSNLPLLSTALCLNCLDKIDKAQTGGRFSENGEVFNSSSVLLHK